MNTPETAVVFHRSISVRRQASSIDIATRRESKRCNSLHGRALQKCHLAAHWVTSGRSNPMGAFCIGNAITDYLACVLLERQRSCRRSKTGPLIAPGLGRGRVLPCPAGDAAGLGKLEHTWAKPKFDHKSVRIRPPDIVPGRFFMKQARGI